MEEEKKNSTMIGLKLKQDGEEEADELELGLSIGGSFKNLEKLKPTMIKKEPVQFQQTMLRSSDSDLRENHRSLASDFELERMAMDPVVKREMEALRRKETKMKLLKQKQLRKSISWLKSPELEQQEFDDHVNERECKKSRVEEANNGSEEKTTAMKNVDPNFSVDNRNMNMNHQNNVTAVFPVMYPYPSPVQYIPFANGFGYPCVNMVPCWAGFGNDVVQQPVVNQSFRNFEPPSQVSGLNASNVCFSEQNSKKTGSNGSPKCSSSVFSSDYRTSSHEGGGSSDSRSNSSHSLQEQHLSPSSNANDTKGQSENSASSHSMETAQVYEKTTACNQKIESNISQLSSAATTCTTNWTEQTIPSNTVHCNPMKPKEEVVTEPQSAPLENPVSTTENPSTENEESNKIMGKPPKPETQNQNASSLPNMPCVSTRGDGPNGKTVNGFLYRYTKAEVSIICVCHGTSFSPAEFVQHAGGTDVSNPLRHITVIPSAF